MFPFRYHPLDIMLSSLTTFSFQWQGLQKEGYEAIFVGIGLPQPKKIGIFADLDTSMGFYTSKDFLPQVTAASKSGQLTHSYIAAAIV